MTENQRLKKLIHLLNFKTQKEFAQKMNIKEGSLSDVLRGRVGISTSIKDKLGLMFGVNVSWLESGKGEYLLPVETNIAEAKEGVPYFNISLSDVENFIIHEEQAEYLVNFKPFNDCTAYLPVYGDSMYPKYASGEIIAIKEVTNYDVLQWGEAYFVITDEEANNIRSIKLLYEHQDKNKIILRSSNPNFKGDIVIARQNIRALYIVRGKITRNSI